MLTAVETPASNSVLDASALLAVLLQEVGSGHVVNAIDAGAAISTVNLTEVLTRCLDGNVDQGWTQQQIESFQLAVYDFTAAQAYAAALLRPLTRSAGLSLGDRACLALAAELGVPAMTADRSWAGLQLDIVIQVIR